MSEPIIHVRELTRSFRALEALKGLDLDVERGDIYGLIGPNGAGKTTTMKILATLLRPTSGLVRVCGSNVDVDSEKAAVRPKIGYMPETGALYPELKVREYLAFFAAAYGIERKKIDATVEGTLELVDLTHRRDSIAKNLSKGMQQRLNVARVLIHDPELLLLDEPAAGLDPRGRIELRELLKELRDMGKTIFISSHVLADLEHVCNRVGIIEEGRLLYSGDLASLRRQLAVPSTLALRVTGDVTEAVRVINQIPGATKVESHDEELSFEYSGGEPDCNELLGHLMRAGVKVVELKREEVTLEALFMKLTEGVVS